MIILRFETPGPVVKKLMTKSSSDRVKANIMPVMIPGRSWGNTTFQNEVSFNASN